ncbi:Conserved oligomeric Golgi complex subunit 7 [Trinorchestia longiramus]|nr:Conserved oligomeric Golgi complex subunit 7 [Trinorchestia longiramus]
MSYESLEKWETLKRLTVKTANGHKQDQLRKEGLKVRRRVSRKHEWKIYKQQSGIQDGQNSKAISVNDSARSDDDSTAGVYKLGERVTSGRQQAEDKHIGGRQRAVSESEVSAADFLIGRVALNTCTMFADAVLRIPLLHQHAHAQLITDIEYICNILEDLGVGSCRPLDHLLALLKAAPREFSSVSERLEGAPIRMIAAVRQMRDISATT